MGKDLNGKELGQNLRQRFDGKYIARCMVKSGKRPEKSFDKLCDAKAWLAEIQYLDKHTNLLYSQSMTLDTWYQYWIENIKKPTVRITTLKSYKTRYNGNIKKLLGNMVLSDIKPLHCQMVLNEMSHCKQGTQELTRVCMQQIFNAAVDNGLLEKSPVTSTVKVKKTEKTERRVFTADEQEKFVEFMESRKHKYTKAYLFCLETGLRVGELKALRWTDVQEDKITVNQTLTYVDKEIGYVTNEPKTEAGKRVIPLTMKAREILKQCKNRKVLSHYVFCNHHGEHLTKADLNACLSYACKKIGLKNITMHGLRHSFATRCIERGMRPKTLQKILGHSSLSITMDLYVHVTEDSLMEEMLKMESKVVGE